jgi:hypothetical protein
MVAPKINLKCDFTTNELSEFYLEFEDEFTNSFSELILFSKPKLSLYEKNNFLLALLHFRLQIKFKTLEPTGLVTQKQW